MLPIARMTPSGYAISLAERTPRALLLGAAAGAAATMAMSMLMLVAQRSGLLGRTPPRHIVEHTLSHLHIRTKVSRRNRQLLTAVAHFGFGAAQGALYAALHQWVARHPQPPLEAPRPEITVAPSAATGVPFALLVWAVSYAGWIPALGILPSPARDRPGRPMSMVLAHVVYGVALASILKRLRHPPAPLR